MGKRRGCAVGAVSGCALCDGAVIAATEALDESDPLDPADLEGREYFDDLGAALAVEHERGAAATIAARFEFDA